MRLDVRDTLTALLAKPPSARAWVALCEVLAPLEGEELEAALAVARGPVGGWPAELRRCGPYYPSGQAADPWLQPVFGGRFDPRLELVGWATVEHSTPFADPSELCGGDFVPAIRAIVVAFARFVDPSFDPVDTVLHRDSEFTSAAGCGGGFDEEVRGDERRGLRWYDTTTEHAADYSADGAWTPYGLAWPGTLSIGRRERGAGDYHFKAAGPTPAVLELAWAWGMLVGQGAGVTGEDARAALAVSRAPWRQGSASAGAGARG